MSKNEDPPVQESAPILKITSYDPKPTIDAYEVERSSVRVRPCLFHEEGVSGLMIYEDAYTDDSSPGWYVYYQTASGDRRCVPLEPCTSLPDGSPMYFAPMPEFLDPDAPPRWSIRGRGEFLDGYVPDLEDLFYDLQGIFETYMEFPNQEITEGATATLALWTVLSYVYPAWPTVPYLTITGDPGCGKTVLLSLLEAVVFSPIMSASAPPAFISRTLDSTGGTLLLDESEHLGFRSAGASEYHRVLNSGYRRGGRIHRVDTARGGRRPISFHVFGPKALASTTPLSPALGSRCIPLRLARASIESKVACHRFDERSEPCTDIRDQLFLFSLSHGSEIVRMAERWDLCEFANREHDLWLPILGNRDLRSPSHG